MTYPLSEVPGGCPRPQKWVSARRPGPELAGVAYGPDVRDPVGSDVEREHRHGDAVELSDQAGLAVDRALQDRHAGCPAGQAGQEVSGVVTALGPGTAGIAVGDEVFGLTDPYRDAVAAEYVAVEARNVAPKPQTADQPYRSSSGSPWLKYLSSSSTAATSAAAALLISSVRALSRSRCCSSRLCGRPEMSAGPPERDPESPRDLNQEKTPITHRIPSQGPAASGRAPGLPFSHPQHMSGSYSRRR
jgi:hypothetical protein